MGKRKRVSRALKEELNEYTSLLRALRANNSVDVTPFLIQPNNTVTERASPTSSHELFPEPSPCSDSSPQSPESQPTSPTLTSRRKRDTFTRWPLLLKETPVPQWSLEDELRHIVDRVFIRYRPPFSPVTVPSVCRTSSGALANALDAELEDENKEDGNQNDGEHDDYIQEDDEVAGQNKIRDTAEQHDEQDRDEDKCAEALENVAFFLPYLTSTADNYLCSILALIAAHTPNRSFGQQNRIAPMGWCDILNIVSSSPDPDVADPNIINAVKRRLEEYYGPPSEHDSAAIAIAVHRIKRRNAARDKVKAQLSQLSKSILEFPERPLSIPTTIAHRQVKTRSMAKSKGKNKVQDNESGYENG